jgi:ankyrin repeat protein
MAGNPIETFCRAVWRHEHETIAAFGDRVDPNGADRWGYTPLLMAARYGDLALVSLLVRRGAEVDQQRKHLTPITFAARRKAIDIVNFLRDQQATESIVTWIHLGDAKRVKQVLARDSAQATLRDEEDTPILHHAAEALNPVLVKLLLKHGARITEVDPNGETPLHRCADIRQAPQKLAATMANLLLDRGADPNARNWDDVTPLHQAVRARNVAVVEVLLARGADPNARDRGRGSTPLRRAVSGTGAGGTAGTDNLMAPLTRMLLAYGADPEARDKRGVPVHASASSPELREILNEHRRAGRSTARRTRNATKRGDSSKRKRKS